jgi:hypothetical protein
MKRPEVLDALEPVARAFQRLGVAYHVGGSVASSTHGVARSTLDVDLVAELRPEHAAPLVEELSPSYYVDGDSIRSAIAEAGSFNVVHLATMVKIDVFVPAGRPFDREVQRRARPQPFSAESGAPVFPVKSAEDILLAKLEWFGAGGGTSDRQWNDVVGIVRAQGEKLDRSYLQHWGDVLGVTGLLERAFDEAR